MVFLSNYLVFKIVLAALGRVDYPVAGDLELKYDTANKIYLSGGSLDYVYDATLYTTIAGETTSYGLSVKSDSFINSKQLFNPNAGEKMANDGWFNKRIWANGDGTRFVVLADQYGSYGRVYIYEHSGGSWTQVKYYDKPNQSNSRMSLYCVMNREGNRIWVDGNPYAYLWERGSSEWPSSTTHAWNDASNRGLGMNEAGTILTSADASWNNYYGRTRVRYVNSSGNWASTDLNGSSQSQWGFESVLNKEGDKLWQTSFAGVKIWHRTDAYGASWSHVHTPVNTNSFSSNCKLCAISDTGYSFVSGNGDNDSSRGRIYFYSYDGNSHPVQLTFIDGENQNDRFGAGLSMSGDGTVAAVGAHSYPSNANDGRVYVYVKSGGSWSLSQTLDKIQSGEKFGSGVALSNDGKTLFVGASENDSGGTDAGCVYVFKKDIYGFFNLYITDAGKYSVDATIAGLNYKTNELDITSLNIPAKVVQVSAGGIHSLALTQDGFVYAWGKGQFGRLGQGSGDVADKNTPVKVKGVGGIGYLSNITKIAAGGYHNIVLASDGKMYTWGYNGYGNLGDGTQTQRETPVEVSYSGDAVSNISCGFAHTAFTTTTGKVYCFGHGPNGQIGNNANNTNTLNPTQVVGVGNSGTLAGIRDVTCGDSFTHAIKDSDGSVYGWGKNTYGMLGDGTTTDRNTPVPVILAGGSAVTGITQISGGGDYALMLKSDGTVYTCGYGANGQLGDGGTSNNDTGLVQVLGVGGSGNLTDITQIAAAESTSLALKSDGTMYSWGNNADGQNGLGTVGGTNPTTPVAITLLTGVDSINAGGKPYHFIASKPDGSVFCCGKGDSSQLGDGTNTADQGTPTQVLAGAGPSLDGKFNLLTEPRLTFDGYNKLSLLHGLSSVSSKLFLGSNVYDIGTLTSDLTIETPGLYRGLVFDTSSNVAYFNKTTVGAIASTMAGYEVEQILYGTHDSDTISQGGFGHYIDTNGDGTRFVLGLGMDPTTGQYDGRAKVYHLESGTWTLKVDLASPNTGSERFGDSVCMNEDGTRIVVNHYPNNKAYIYDYASGAWPTTPTVTLIGTTSFGEGDMDMNKAGTVIVFGSRAYGTQIWSRAGDGTWSETKNWGNGQGGYGVAINGAGTRIVTG